MKYFVTRTFVVWAVVLIAFFLASGANIHISEWSHSLRTGMLLFLLITAGVIGFRSSDYTSED